MTVCILDAGSFNEIGKWLSLVEHSVRDAGAGGSNPLFPTISVTALSSQPSVQAALPVSPAPSPP